MSNAALNSIKGLTAVAALALGAGFFASSTTAASAVAVPGMPSIEGSWDATITFGGASSRAMYSFHSDSTMTEADNPGFDPNFNGDALSPGIGSWELSSSAGVGARAKYQKFAYGTDGQLNLVYTSTMLMRTAQPSGTLSGVINIEIALPDGTVVSAIPNLPFTATRIGAF